MRKLTAIVISCTALVLGLAACGSSGSSKTSSSAPNAPATSTPASTASSAPAGGTATQSIAANSSGLLKFTKSSLTAKAGKVTFTFTNSSPLSHNFTIQRGTSGAIVGATPTFQGGTKSLTVTLKPGTYTFFCSVPGHRMAGMQGTLTVS
jgi:uncharacterized cupredoxin-like copper-binding protein